MNYILEAIKRLNLDDVYFTPSQLQPMIDYIESKDDVSRALYGNPPFKERSKYNGDQ